MEQVFQPVSVGLHGPALSQKCTFFFDSRDFRKPQGSGPSCAGLFLPVCFARRASGLDSLLQEAALRLQEWMGAAERKMGSGPERSPWSPGTSA